MLSSGETGSTVGYSSESGGHYTDSISTLSSEGEITPTRTANKGKLKLIILRSAF